VIDSATIASDSLAAPTTTPAAPVVPPTGR
jgi:hypothetical protein